MPSDVPVPSSNLRLSLDGDQFDTVTRFTGSYTSRKPETKLEVLNSRQINNVIKFNIVVWTLAFSVLVIRAVLMNTVLLIPMPVVMPNGKTKDLKWYPSNHIYYLLENIGSLILCFIMFLVATSFTAGIIQSRATRVVPPQVIWVALMLCALSASMNPMSYIWIIHDYSMMNIDIMHPTSSHWASQGWNLILTGAFWLIRVSTYTVSSIFFLWGTSHQLALLESIETRKQRFHFYAPKIIPLLAYNLLRLYAFGVEKIVLSVFPLTGMIGMIQNFSTMGVWYTRIVIITSILTMSELVLLAATFHRMRSTMSTLRTWNYIETRSKQVCFRFLVCSSFAYYLIFIVYDALDRAFGPNYFNIGSFLKASEPKIHCFEITGIFGRDILLVGHACATAYAYLPPDSSVLFGWFRKKALAGGDNAEEPAQPISLNLSEDKDGDGVGSLSTLSCTNQCILPSHITCFNFAWLAYSWEKENHGGAIPDLANFDVRCHVKHEETDTNLLIIDSSDRIIIAFKGTTSKMNMKTDLKVFLVPLLENFPTREEARKQSQGRESRNAKIHKGFIQAYSAIGEKVMTEVENLLLDGERPIFLTGHSLGAALATLCSLDICLSLGVSNRNVVVSTFGSPRCGNSSWRKLYDSFITSHWRFARSTDIVTKMPFGLSYQHVGKEVSLSSGGEMWLDPSGIERVLWNGEVANMKTHTKGAYLAILKIFCAKYLDDYSAEFWEWPLSNEEKQEVQTIVSTRV